MNLSKLWEIVEDRGGWSAAVHVSQRVRYDLTIEEQKQQLIKEKIEDPFAHSFLKNIFLKVVYMQALGM